MYEVKLSDQEWLREMFLYNDCDQCGTGASGHYVRHNHPYHGSRWAECKEQSSDD